MKRLDPSELPSKTRPVLLARLKRSTFDEMFPVEMGDLGEYEPEPSIGALVRLASRSPFMVVYGTVTGNLVLEASARRPIASAIEELYREIPRLRAFVSWEAREPVREERDTKKSPATKSTARLEHFAGETPAAPRTRRAAHHDPKNF